jgi:hypothetical protein
MTKSAAISTLILDDVAAGATPAQALDKILGEGAFAKLAGDLYDAFRGAPGTAEKAHAA